MILTFWWVNNPQMIYATIFCKSFYLDGVRTRVELVPVHSINRSATAAIDNLFVYQAFGANLGRGLP